MDRPALHHTAPSGWVNDPHALVHHDGLWHLWFQHVPGATAWDVACHWGHATSPDLVTWTARGVDLVPDATEDGCWSGNVVLAPGPVGFYTSVRRPDLDHGRVRSVDLTTGQRSGVLVEAPAGAAHFRDPFVHRVGDGWRMVVGGGTSDGAATLWAFSSPDLAEWAYDGVVASRPATAEPFTGRAWECPVLLDVDGTEVLVVSVWEPDRPHHVAYRVGETWRRLTYGPSHYAASTFTDPDGRPGLVTWLREVTGDGWAGATSLPMTVTLDGDRLVARPHPAVPADAVRCWRPGDDTGPRFALAPRDGAVTVTAGRRSFELPWAGEPLRYVVDGPVLELYGDLGVAAVPVAP